jgi:hypothetical protein
VALAPLGGQASTILAAPVTETHSGPATIDLGAALDGVTNAALELRCLTPGAFHFPDGAGMICLDADAGSRTGIATYSFPLAPGQHTISIEANPGALAAHRHLRESGDHHVGR